MNRIATKMVQVDLRKSVASQNDKIEDKDAIESSGSKDGKATSKEPEEVLALEKRIKRLKKSLHKVQRQQEQDRHRQAVHTAVNQDSNNHMVVGSLIETLIFMGTASFQVIFVRKWFAGKGPQNWA
uniref:GOLD domain-containing protein n=2 Tax=Octactis speculum TaxID=3111310 RepID=A0A7S2FVP9_9STRA|mmetsp:Transcript_32549/g.44033  ORF Transcript_32549/g.44033 Transcript_32549/m.44033 type:complete len:126 (+) Transcript_32549:92-469(+)